MPPTRNVTVRLFSSPQSAQTPTILSSVLHSVPHATDTYIWRARLLERAAFTHLAVKTAHKYTQASLHDTVCDVPEVASSRSSASIWSNSSTSGEADAPTPLDSLSGYNINRYGRKLSKHNGMPHLGIKNASCIAKRTQRAFWTWKKLQTTTSCLAKQSRLSYSTQSKCASHRNEISFFHGFPPTVCYNTPRSCQPMAQPACRTS